MTLFLYTFVIINALKKSSGLTERITNVNFHPLTNLNQENLKNKIISFIIPKYKTSNKTSNKLQCRTEFITCTIVYFIDIFYQSCTKLTCLIDIKISDFFIQYGSKKSFTKTTCLTFTCNRPESNLKISYYYCSTSNNYN